MASCKFQHKPKRAKANWTTAFPEQHSQLHPEKDAGRTRIGRSASEELRMKIYLPIAAMFKERNQICKACDIIIPGIKSFRHLRKPTEDVHHKRGRSGLLLFDIRYWIPVCRVCHDFIRDNPQKARELGLDESHQIC